MSTTAERAEPRILIVDDKPANLDLLRDILQPAGHAIFFATGGRKALEIAASVIPDLVLLDVMMPGMDGFETCRRLKGQASLADVPVIFITARTDVEELVQGFEAGGVDYITKPVKRPEVLARVDAHLQIRALIRTQNDHLAALERARRELLELNEVKDKFLSNLGRQVGQALAGMSRASEQLQQAAALQELAGDELSLRVDGVDRGARRVLELLETILEWPRVQAGQKLDLLATRLSDEELGNLVRSLDDLRFLSLAETRITDAGVAHLARLRGLEELHLDDTEVGDAGLETLAALPGLRVLDLKRTKITDAGLARLQPLRGLRGLYLTGTAVTDAGLAHLRGLAELETLILWDTGISDAGLPHLRGLSRLRELILWNTRVTERGVAALQAHLPECDISTTAF
jgi:DNA-binding response OmpR family regulator